MLQRLGILGVVLLACAGPASAAEAAPCELQGSPARAHIRVRVPDHSPLYLELTGGELLARFRSVPRATVETLGPLRITGTAVDLPLRLARPVLAAGGHVRLSTDVAIVRALPHRSGLRLDVQIAGHATIGALLSSVVVACNAVEIREEEVRPSRVEPAGQPSWFARRRTLVLRARPYEAPRLRVIAAEPRALLLAEVARLGDRVHVRAEWSDGSAVEGWTERAALTPIPSAGFGWGSAWGEPGRATCSRHPVERPGGYVGPARLRAGATFYAAPGRGPWAEVREDIGVEVELGLVSDEAWVRVVMVPGIAERDACGQLDHAWVARTDVILTPP